MFGLVIAIALLQAGTAAQESQCETDCGFAKVQPRQISHFVERCTLTRAAPKLAPEARAKGLFGRVRIRVLVNNKGRVEKTCPAYIPGERRPDFSLVEAAEAAAQRWTFRANFGFGSGQKVRFKYVEDVIEFRFAPPK